MNHLLFRWRKLTRPTRRHRSLRAEALEGRMLLTSITALPFSVVLLDQTSSGLPPDPCIQFTPQPPIAAATSNTPVQWKGHFSERLRDSSPTTAAAPTAWMVDVVYSLKQGPSPYPVPLFIVKGGYNFYVSGTATETLIPLSASGSPIASAQAWVSKDNIQSQVMVLPSMGMNPVANTFTFTTNTTIRQTMTPLVPAATAPTTLPSWSADTTTHTTGSITEAPSYTSGTYSLNEQINQTLSPVSATVLSPAWTISAQFAGSGTFQEALPPKASTAASDMLTLNGALTGTLSPPKGSLLPTQMLNSQVQATVAFWPTS